MDNKFQWTSRGFMNYHIFRVLEINKCLPSSMKYLQLSPQQVPCFVSYLSLRSTEQEVFFVSSLTKWLYALTTSQHIEFHSKRANIGSGWSCLVRIVFNVQIRHIKGSQRKTFWQVQSVKPLKLYQVLSNTNRGGLNVLSSLWLLKSLLASIKI